MSLTAVKQAVGVAIQSVADGSVDLADELLAEGDSSGRPTGKLGELIRSCIHLEPSWRPEATHVHSGMKDSVEANKRK